MATILCLETSSANCSAALFRHGVLLALKEEAGSYAHAEKLHLFIREILLETATDISNLEAIAVSTGPGSFTGLRIGVAAAKGLCYALDLPLIAIATLCAMSRSVVHNSMILANSDLDFVYCPMIDARRMEVYMAHYGRDFSEMLPPTAHVLAPDDFRDRREQGKIAFFGDGMPKFRKLLDGDSKAIFIDDIVPSSQWMGIEAELKFRNGIFEQIAYFEPFYLKEFHATTPKKLL